MTRFRPFIGRPVSYSGMVKAAGDEAQGSDLTGQAALFCWMLSSGIAHAKTWAVLSFLDRVEVPGMPGLAENQMGLILSASGKAVSLITSVTTLMVIEGWRLLDERGRGYPA